jgi:hypothetical protein
MELRLAGVSSSVSDTLRLAGYTEHCGAVEANRPVGELV